MITLMIIYDRSGGEWRVPTVEDPRIYNAVMTIPGQLFDHDIYKLSRRLAEMLLEQIAHQEPAHE